MAGNYADVPGPRMALDLDGSQVISINTSAGNAITALTTQQIKDLGDESEASFFNHANYSSGQLAVIFPEKRNLIGVYQRVTTDGGTNIDNQPVFSTSVDTTTGLDGTWTALTGPARDTVGPVNPRYRQAISAVSANGIIAVRYAFNHTGGSNGTWQKALHLYGSIAAGENPDRLALWHPTLDQALGGAALDEGDAKRTTSGDLTFRVKNLSAAQTATTITLSQDVLTDTAPTFASQHTLSSGGAFASTATIASLAPGAISAVCTLRRATSATAVLGTYAARIQAAAASWA